MDSSAAPHLPPPPYCSSVSTSLFPNPATVHLPPPNPDLALPNSRSARDPSPSSSVPPPDPPPPPSIPSTSDAPPPPPSSSAQISAAPPPTSSSPAQIPNPHPSNTTSSIPPPPHSLVSGTTPRGAAPRGSAPSPHQQSYAQAARSSRGPSFVRAHASAVEFFAKIPRTGVNIICGSKEGIPSFSFVASDLPRVEDLYANALVMKFHGGRPSLEASHKEILSWGIDHPFSIGPLTSRAFLLQFQDNIDLLKVLTRPSTTLITFPYKIFRWHNLCHLKEDSCLAPVWISLPKLPLQCFIPEFLESVANKIGRFLCFDKATTTLARPSAARMCVELDLRKPPPQFIWVGLFDGFKQQIIYEKMPKFCNACHMQGHISVSCSKEHLDTLHNSAAAYSSVPLGSTPSVRQNSSKNPVIPSPNNSLSAIPTSKPTSILNAPTPRSSVLPPSSSLPLPNSTPMPDTFLNTNPCPVNPGPHPNGTVHQLPPPTPNTSTTAASYLHPSQLPPQPPSNNHIPTRSAAAPSPVDAPPPPPSLSTMPLTPLAVGSSTPDADQSINLHKNQQSSRQLKGKQKHKSVTFEMQHIPQQSNLSANKEFWDVVNRQVATIEQARLKNSSLTSSATPSVFPHPSLEDPAPSTNAESSPTDHSSDESSGSSIAADSPPASPHSVMQDAQNSDLNIEVNTYDSEGDERPTEPSPLQGHNTDILLHQIPQSSKRNKRHPDQPLKVQLRVRKDPHPASLCQ